MLSVYIIISVSCEESVDPEMYTSVMQRMDEYCSKKYTRDDDRTIELYSKCFSSFLLADETVVNKCRAGVYKENAAIKMADCVKEETPETERVRDCIKNGMAKIDPKYKFDSVANSDLITKKFFECMNNVFRK
ncbi:hypothetical protein HDE_10697 [Halotydeus destructor]|nr:hypothetical protein HDE_10697 [Halotydeus destructor]